MTLKAVFLDLDQTLVDRAQTFQTYLQQQYTDLCLIDYGVEATAFYQAVHQWDNNGYRDKTETFTRVVAQLNLAVTPDMLMAHFRANYGRDAVLFDGVYAWLANASEHWPLLLVSNGRQSGQAAKLQVTGIGGFFRHLVISESVGCKKPEPEIYAHACELLGVAAQEVLFVGDHPINDVSAPRALGMKTVWVRSAAYDAPEACDFVVNSVTDMDPKTMTPNR